MKQRMAARDAARYDVLDPIEFDEHIDRMNNDINARSNARETARKLRLEEVNEARNVMATQNVLDSIAFEEHVDRMNKAIFCDSDEWCRGPSWNHYMM